MAQILEPAQWRWTQTNEVSAEGEGATTVESGTSTERLHQNRRVAALVVASLAPGPSLVCEWVVPTTDRAAELMRKRVEMYWALMPVRWRGGSTAELPSSIQVENTHTWRTYVLMLMPRGHSGTIELSQAQLELP